MKEAINRSIRARSAVHAWESEDRWQANMDIKKWASCEQLGELLIKLDCNGCLAPIVYKYFGEQ